MNMPGFTAENSLDETRAQYRANINQLIATEVNVLPQAKIVGSGPGGNRELNRICAQIGALINETVQEAIDPNTSAGNRQELLALAGAMIGRTRTRGICTLSTVP